MSQRLSDPRAGTRSRLTVVSGVGAVSLLVMATLLIGVVASPVLTAKGEDRSREGQPQRQVEHVRQIAQTLVRAASKIVRTQRDVPLAVGLTCVDRSGEPGKLSRTMRGDAGKISFETQVRVGLLNLPPPTMAGAAG